MVIGETSKSSGGGFVAGFGMLIGTQVVVVICGVILWMRERARVRV